MEPDDYTGAPDDLLTQLRVVKPAAAPALTPDQAAQIMGAARRTGAVPAVDYSRLVSSLPANAAGGVIGYMADKGYGVQNMPSYLPAGQGGATQAGSGSMDETQAPEDGALGTLSQQPAAGGAQPMPLGDLISQRLALASQQASQAKSAYDDAAAQLKQQRSRQSGLSASDLFRLSAAFATPTRYSSFMGTLANVSPVLADIAQAREKAAADYPAQLAALRQKYQDAALNAKIAGLKDVTTPVEKAAQFGRPVQRRTGFDPVTGVLKYMDTGETVAPAVGTVQGGYRFKGGDPASPTSWEKVT